MKWWLCGEAMRLFNDEMGPMGRRHKKTSHLQDFVTAIRYSTFVYSSRR